MHDLKKLIVILIISLTIISKSFGQLVGTYSIGGTNPDYSTINSAINDIAIKGVSGTVVFNIRPGTYPGFNIGSMSKLMYPDSIILQSETHDSSDVVISGYAFTIGLNGAYGITLRWLTIEATSPSQSVAVQFGKSYHCNILNCLINTPNSLGNVADGRSAFDIKHNTELPLSSIRIENCQLIGKGCGFYIKGNKGFTQIINCNVVSTGRYSITTGYLVENLKIQDCYLTGETDFDDASGSASVFKNNVLIGKDIDVKGFALVEGNEFICLDTIQFIKVNCGKLKNNHFHQNVTITVTSKLIESNRFESEVWVYESDKVQFFTNTVAERIRFQGCNNMVMTGNVMHGITDIIFSDFVSVFNNIFYDEVDNAISYNNKFYYNNFMDSALLSSQVSEIDAEFNNFNQELSVVITSKMKYNNYYPSGGLWDQHPYHYNPEYLSSSTPRATNPRLMGKGELVSFVTNDIDGVSRPKNPTLGASEICVSSFGEMKKVVMDCGDAILLRRCGANSLRGYRWYPSIGLNDTISATPIAKPIASTLYYFKDSTGIILDSVMIEVKGFNVEGFDTIYLPACGYSDLLSGNFNPSASYKWSPAEWLSDSTIYNPLATPRIATTYVQEISIPGCGLFVDSVFVDLNPAPIADALPAPNYQKVTFYNFSSCADQFLWNFGDGLQSTTEEPIHIYDSSGVYDGSLIASNQFGSDTFNFSVKVLYVGIKDIAMKSNNFSVYPNPSSGLIHVELNKMAVNTTFSVYNFLGQLIHSKLLDSVANFDYNLPEAKGVYIIQFIEADGTLYSRKVIKK